MVVSHERSGTHFTMNTLAARFGYVSAPWVDMDREDFSINYFYPEMFGTLVRTFAGLGTTSIAKSHHEFAFFKDFLGEVRELDVVYVHRRPADVMASLWRFLHTWPWIEGPKVESPLALANAEPMGQLMRYQHRQYDTMLDRWANHVAGWVEAATQFEHVHLVRYDDLTGDFEGAVAKIGEELRLGPIGTKCPLTNENVVASGPLAFHAVEGERDRDLITLLALRRHPELMARLGYVSSPKIVQSEDGRSARLAAGG